jgi:hypothetical protein
VLRKAGVVLTVGGIVLFVVSFLHVLTGNVPSQCVGGDCLKGEARWFLVMPASILAFVGGVIMISFGGRGYGRTSGPKSFEEVDSGAWSPQERQAQATEEGPTAPRWSRSWRNLYLYTGAGEIGLAVLFVVGAIKQPEAGAGLGVTAAILGVIGIVFLIIGARAAARDRLHDAGVSGQATIAGITQTGMWMNNNPYVKLDLVIQIPGHPPYEVKHGEIVPQVLLGRLTNGASLPVRVDPDRPSHFVVEWERG